MNNDILTNTDRIHLSQARRRGRKSATIATVETYKKPVYRLTGTEERRLARWENLETALIRLLSDCEVRGPVAGDKRRAQSAIHLLQDTFGDK